MVSILKLLTFLLNMKVGLVKTTNTSIFSQHYDIGHLPVGPNIFMGKPPSHFINSFLIQVKIQVLEAI